MTSRKDRDRIPDEYKVCRMLQHAWDFSTVERKGRDYVQGLVCIRCGTERLIRVDARTGFSTGSRYRYADGYLVEGGLSQRDRADLRLTLLVEHQDPPSARRQRRRKK